MSVCGSTYYKGFQSVEGRFGEPSEPTHEQTHIPLLRRHAEFVMAARRLHACQM